MNTLAKAALIATALTPACHPIQVVPDRPTENHTLPSQPLIKTPAPEIKGSMQEAKASALKTLGATTTGMQDINCAIECVTMKPNVDQERQQELAGDYARMTIEKNNGSFDSPQKDSKCIKGISHTHGRVMRICCTNVCQ